MDNNIIPKYAQVKIKNNNTVAKKVKEQTEKLWIKLEIRSLYGLINRYNGELYDRHIELLRIYSVERKLREELEILKERYPFLIP